MSFHHESFTIEIEVDDGKEAFIEKFEQQDEHWVTIRFGIRNAWQWPEWLRSPWIAMDENGTWYCFDEEPSILEDNNEWAQRGYWWRLLPQFCDFTPPPCTDWRQSKRRRPTS